MGGIELFPVGRSTSVKPRELVNTSPFTTESYEKISKLVEELFDSIIALYEKPGYFDAPSAANGYFMFVAEVKKEQGGEWVVKRFKDMNFLNNLYNNRFDAKILTNQKDSLLQEIKLTSATFVWG